MAQKKSILIIDDHPLFREGLRSIIEKDSRFEVLGEAGNGRDGFRMAGELKPDLVLMDISLPDENGIELTKEIRNLSAQISVMIISMHTKIELIAEAFRSGATGYLVKGSSKKKLLQSIESVLEGEYYLDGAVSKQVVKMLLGSPERNTKIHDSAYKGLTLREQEILRLLAEGFSPKKIGEKLFISPKTVENHRYNIMSKLKLHGIYDLIRYAAKLGLIDVDLWKA